jgi:hypothetical protein
MIVSYGIGLIFYKDAAKAKQIVIWELGKLAKYGRLFLKLVLRTISSLCNWLHSKI